MTNEGKSKLAVRRKSPGEGNGCEIEEPIVLFRWLVLGMCLFASLVARF